MESNDKMAVRAEMNERELIQACQAGDRGAFHLLFESYQHRVYSLAMNFCGNSSQAQDITQEVFLKLFRCLGQFQQQASFSTWLHRIVVNTCLNERRRNQRWVSLEDPEPEANAVQGNQESDLRRREFSRALCKAVTQLEPELRMVLLLRYLEGLSYAEIAAASECSIGTVSSRLNRAHRLLGKRLWDYRSVLT